MKVMGLRSPAEVARHGSSLIFHDLGIVSGRTATEDGRRPLADGAGVLESVGAGAIWPVVDGRFPLEQLSDAFRFEMSGGHLGRIGVEL